MTPPLKIHSPSIMDVHRRKEALTGVIMGTAVGDALGLPMEGISARRQRKLFPSPLRHRLLGPYGMISDDTEHTFMVAQALLESAEDSVAFQRNLARRLRWWLVGLPAGVGLATLRAILKLWAGFPPRRSGVASAGNGAAMRSALLGVYFAGQPLRRREFVRACTLITHHDPRAIVAAMAVAEAGAWMSQQREDMETLWQSFLELSTLREWAAIVAALRKGLEQGLSTGSFADELGVKDGVSGYAFESVPVAIYAALRHRGDFATAISEAIACGGDTDTVGAITGALAGAGVGADGISQLWQDGILEFPRSAEVFRRAAERLNEQAEGHAGVGAVRYFWPAIPLRNLVFLAVVLAHGFRRLLPPY